MGQKSSQDILISLAMGERERNPRADFLETLREPVELADYLRSEREKLIQRLREEAHIPPNTARFGGLRFTHELSSLMDAVVTRIFTLACSRGGANPGTLQIAIVATGGYGRQELSPFSDIDITFIPHRDGDPTIDRIIREMFTMVMDICISRCGLEVGYAYRLLEDCAALDHQTASGLLDARLIAGSERLFIRFEDAFWMGFNPADFIFTKINEREKSLKKWGCSPRVVEPQLKEGPGGMRDLHTAVWLVQARANLAAARVRGNRAFDVLVRETGVTQIEAERLAHAKELLFRARNALHALVGSERDELVITRQEEVAALLGYEHPDCPKGSPPVERFMADVYPALALIRRIADQMIRRVGSSRLILGIGLDCKHRQIIPANSALQNDDPAWLLWACELAQMYKLDLGERLERAAVALVEIEPVLPDAVQSALVFTRILSRRGGVYSILQKMADLGILGWYLPEFGRLMDLIPYDPSHDHTVGQHSLRVVRNLEALLEAEGPEEFAEMRRVMEELPHPEQLFLAALLHDGGKATPGRPHAEISEELAEVVCRRLNWTDEAAANVKFLVRQHLLMAETSRLRDLNIEETIRDFTQVVNDPDRLNMLYLLTYADTRAVGSGVWTQVIGRFLRDLWLRASSVLCTDEPLGYDDASIARARRRLMKDLSLENLPEEEVNEHIQAMPPEYLLNHTLNQIALHIGFIRRVRSGELVSDFHDERDATYTELTVSVIDDPKPGLLAKITGALYAADVEIHSAQVLTRVTDRDRIALDTLWVDFRGRQLTPGKRREVTGNLREVLTGAQTVSELLLKRRVRPGAPAAPANGTSRMVVRSVQHDQSDALTFIEAGGADAHGTLYRMCDALSKLGWDIRSARASTWQGEGRVSFYVSGARSLSEQQVMDLLTRIIAG